MTIAKGKIDYLIKNFETMSDDELYEFIIFKLTEEEFSELLNTLYKMKKEKWLDRIYELLTMTP